MPAINGRGVFLCYTEAAWQLISRGGGGQIMDAASIAAHKGSPCSGVLLDEVRDAPTHPVRRAGIGRGRHRRQRPLPRHRRHDDVEEIDRDLGAIDYVGKGESMAAMAAGITRGWVSTGDDIAKLVSCLVGPDPDCITGQSILVDGGTIFV
ncbi:MAG: hypothetical protein ACK5MT_11720 [Actinomycetales bacterium]